MLRLLQQDLVDLLLRHAVVPGAFADEDTLGVAAHQRHDLFGDQPVVNHHVGLLDLLQPFQRQQAGIARPGAHQHHFTAIFRLFAEQLLELAFGQRGVVVGQRLRQPIVGE